VETVQDGQALFLSWLTGGIDGEGMASTPGSGLNRVRHTRLGIPVTIACLTALLMIVPTVAASPSHAHPSVVCPSPTVGQVVEMTSVIPQGSAQLLSVWWTFTNLEDLEISPYYWALDSGVVFEQAWQAPDGSIYLLQVVGLLWHTYAGALSPVAGVPEPKNGIGPEVQAGFLHFTATFTPGLMPIQGSLGNINLGGTKADILLAPGPQVGTGGYDPFTSLYFDGFADFAPTQFVLAESYFYPPAGQEFCATFDILAGSVSYVGDIVT